MEIMLRLEEQFGMAVDADTIAQLISVPEICRYLEANNHASEPTARLHPKPVPVIEFAPAVAIPDYLTGEIQSKLAYVDEAILRAQVSASASALHAGPIAARSH